MTKTEKEIIDAHKQAIEDTTGKTCEIKLVNNEDLILRRTNLKTLEAACENFNTTGASIRTKTNWSEIVKMRQLFYVIARKGGRSFNKIALYMAKDHTNIIYNYKKGVQLLETDENFKRLYMQVIKHITEAPSKNIN